MEEKKPSNGVKWAKRIFLICTFGFGYIYIWLYRGAKGLVLLAAKPFKKKVPADIPEETPNVPLPSSGGISKAVTNQPVTNTIITPPKPVLNVQSETFERDTVSKVLRDFVQPKPKAVEVSSGDENSAQYLPLYEELLSKFSKPGENRSVSLWMKEFKDPSVLKDGDSDSLYKGIRVHDLKTNRSLIFSNIEIPVIYKRDDKLSMETDVTKVPRNPFITINLQFIGTDQILTSITPPADLTGIQKTLLDYACEIAKSFYQPGGTYTREYIKLEASIPQGVKPESSKTVKGYLSVNNYHYDKNNYNISKNHKSFDISIAFKKEDGRLVIDKIDKTLRQKRPAQPENRFIEIVGKKEDEQNRVLTKFFEDYLMEKIMDEACETDKESKRITFRMRIDPNLSNEFFGDGVKAFKEVYGVRKDEVKLKVKMPNPNYPKEFTKDPIGEDAEGEIEITRTMVSKDGKFKWEWNDYATAEFLLTEYEVLFMSIDPGRNIKVNHR